MNTVTRKHKFDMGHRLLNYKGACRNAHGHEYHIEITCQYEQTNELGLGIDFAEIKNKICTWIDNNLDHAFACHPEDNAMIALLEQDKNKLFITKLGNPSAENISKEIFWVASVILEEKQGLTIKKIKLYETTNCYVETNSLSISEIDIFEAHYNAQAEAEEIINDI